MSGPPAPVRPESLIANRPTAPCMWYAQDTNILSLPVVDCEVNASFHVSTAVVHLKITFQNTSKIKLDALFTLPMKGTVTNAVVHIGKNRYMETAVIPKAEAEGLAAKQPPKASAKSTIPKQDPLEKFVPDLFRLPVTGIAVGEQVVMDVDFLEPLEFDGGRYIFNLPLTFAEGVLPPVHVRPAAHVVRINCTVDTVVPEVKVNSDRHTLRITQTGARLDVVALPPETGSVDFNLSYCLLSPSIIGTMIKETAGFTESKDEHGTFALFVTPPSMDHMRDFFSRSIVFLLDRSGSMSGEPFTEACRAYEAALAILKPNDYFTVCMFDHNMVAWQMAPQPATLEAKAASVAWVRANPPVTGATDIMKPMQWALNLLNTAHDPSRPILPFVFLLTDGAVENEREICAEARRMAGVARVLTFGIGAYCNWFFLKMLATIGRGFSDACVYKEAIYGKVVHLLNMAAVPVIQNVTIELAGVPKCELYPFPIPDLFVGAPLLIAGKFEAAGMFPDRVTIRGQTSTGAIVAIEVMTTVNPQIPVNKVFLKQRIDLLTARAWLEKDPAIEAEIVKVCCEESMPSAYTSMVAYETKEVKDDKKDKKDEKKVAKKSNTGAIVAGAAIGGIVVIGAAAVIFGDLGSSLSNAPIGAIGDGLGSMFSHVGNCDCGCLSCLGDCGSCGGCGEIFGHIAGCCGSLCSGCGECFQHVTSCVSGLCSNGCDGIVQNLCCICKLLGCD